MTLLRDAEQAALADLSAWGQGLLLRYRAWLDTDIDVELKALVADLVARRLALFDELADCARARDDWPTAADEEASQLVAGLDRVMDKLGGSEAAAGRILDSELAWLARLRDVSELDWNPRERALLQRLERDAEDAIRPLRDMAA